MDITGIGAVTSFAENLLDRFFPKEMSQEQRAQAVLAMSQEIETRDKAKAQIIAAEMAQGDNYTKRARPTVVYGGLLMIALNYVIFPILAKIAAISNGMPEGIDTVFEPVNLPTEFWWAWGGVVSAWVFGRSMEKKGNVGQLTSLITGIKK